MADDVVAELPKRAPETRPPIDSGSFGGGHPRNLTPHQICEPTAYYRLRMGESPAQLDFKAFDADNHYYEALDAFTRHVPASMQQRCVQWCEINGRKYHVVGGIVSHAVVNPTFDPIAKAGAMHDYFRGNPKKLQPYEFLRERESTPAAYRDRDARIATLDE